MPFDMSDKTFGTVASVAMQLLGGFLGDRSAKKEAKKQRQLSREQMMADRANTRETLRAQMQGDQDAYARTIMRNRAAIRPWGEMYRGPRFTTANPNAPIYNPLMEQDHVFQQLGRPLVSPDPKNPWAGG